MRNRTLQALATRVPEVLELAQVLALVALVAGSILALAVALVPAAELPAAAAAPASPAASPRLAPPDSFAVTADTSLVFRLQAGNRLYPDWKEEHNVHLQEEFPLGDTENRGVVTRLLPDFRIVDGKPRSLSAELKNPAVRILVTRQGAVVDSSWAFLNFPPHFSPKSFFTFQLQNISGYPDSMPTIPATVAAPVEPSGAPAAKPAPGTSPTAGR